jgi:hypothetical protein
MMQRERSALLVLRRLEMFDNGICCKMRTSCSVSVITVNGIFLI